MANFTPKISSAGLGNLDETPACTPVPQASSTIAYWNYDSVPAHINENLKTEYQAIHLKDAIDGLESFSSKLKSAKLQFCEQNKNFLPNNNEFMSANGRCAVGRVSDAESSLGILKEDEMPGLSEDELENKWEHLLPSKSYVHKKSTDTGDLSDLAIDMRYRLQKELAQRAINRVSFLSCKSVDGSLNEPRDTNVGNEFLPNVFLPADVSQSIPKSLQVATVLNHSKNQSKLHNREGHAEEIVNDQTCDKIDKVDESLILSQASGLEAFWNPFDHLKLEGESVGKMAAVMRDFSAEDFVPGDKFGERLASDEAAWKKENVPPVAGPTFEGVSTLDFSGIVGNSEISFHSTDISHCGHPKKRVSVGEFFRLRSEQLDELGTKTNISVYFGMQAESPKKKHKLLPLVESDEDVAQEMPVSNRECTKRTERTYNSPPSSDTRKSSLPPSEHSISQRDSLSLSRIAAILANVDTAASPRTVVSNILKESGLCNPKRIPPVKKTISPQLPDISYTSDTRSAVEGVLKDTCYVGSAAVLHRKDVSSLSDSRCNTSCSLSGSSIIDSARKGVCNVQKEATCTVIDLLDDSDIKGRLSSSTISEESSDGWIYAVPNTTLGVGAILCSSAVKTGHNLPEENKNNDQIFTPEDHISTGDLNDLTYTRLVDNKQLDESVVCLTEERKESVDSCAVVPTLKNPELWSELPKFGMKYIQSGVKPEWNLPLNAVASNQKVSITPTECRLSLQSVMSVSELSEHTWVSLTTPSPSPVVCVGVPHDIMLPVRNVTDHWLLCGLELGEVKLLGEEEDEDYQCAVVRLPSKRVLMDPNNCKEAKIEVVPLCEGKLKISLKVHLNDAVTKAVQSLTCDVFIIGEEPQIVISKADNSNMNLDFGVLPEECAKEMNLKFCNPGSASIPLKLITVHQVQDKLSTFVLLDPEKQKNKNMAESEVSRELTFTLKAGGEMNVTVMFAAPPMGLLTKRRGFVRLSGVLSMVLNGVIPIELESFNLIGSVGTTKLGIFRPAIPMQLVIMGPGKADSCRLPMRNHGVVHLTLALQLLPADTESISMTVEPELVEIPPGEQVEPIIRFTSYRPLKEPVQRILQITMQPHGPVYFVEVTGIMIALSTEEVKKPSKIMPEQPVTTLKEPVMMCKSKSNKQYDMTPSHQSSKGNSLVKSPASNAQSSCSSEWLSIKSQKSSSSGSCKSGEKMNVRTTHRQLVWGSVAVGKSVTKSFAVRSEDSCKLAAYVYVEDKLRCYELIDVDGPVMGEKCITLHPKKSHSFRVSFKPPVIGAAYGKLVFIIQGVHLIIPMYGFGGHARLIAKGVPRDGAGRMWLMLHQGPHKTEWEASFLLQNFGDLKAFIKIKPISKGFQNLNRTSLAVEPSEIVMNEGTSAKIKVTYRPPQQDLKLLLNSSIKDVVEVAALSLTSGDEATRCRLRRIHERNLDMAKRRGPDHPSAQNIHLDLQPLCAQFPGEEDCKTSDIMSLKDPPDSALDLYNAGVNHQEIILLLENATDADSSQAFQSMYQYIVDLSTTRQEDFDESVGSNEWTIEPRALTLHPPHLSSMTVVLRSNGIRKHPFEAVVAEQPPGFLLSISPNAGIIPAAGVVELTVMCTQTDVPQTSQPRFWKGVVKVYIENDYKELNICIQYPPTHNAGVLSKKVAPMDSCKGNTPMSSVGQHHACDTPSGMHTVTKLREKMSSAHLSHKVCAGTGRNNLSSPKCRRKVFVLHTD